MSLRLVLASNNAKKLLELQALLAPSGVELVAQSAFGVDEAGEPFGTFVENALAKARHAARRTGLAALADDSGLCVDALGGAPGVHSARFAGGAVPGGPDGGSVADAPASVADAPASVADAVTSGAARDPHSDREARRRRQDAANNALLLERLAGQGDRRASFVGTLVALRSADDPEPLIAVGRWAGRVLEAPSGEGGFGYDPLIEIDGVAVGRMGAARKNAASHRAIAARRMVELMRASWRLGG